MESNQKKLINNKNNNNLKLVIKTRNIKEIKTLFAGSTLLGHGIFCPPGTNPDSTNSCKLDMLSHKFTSRLTDHACKLHSSLQYAIKFALVQLVSSLMQQT